jgi:hypothetical protein
MPLAGDFERSSGSSHSTSRTEPWNEGTAPGGPNEIVCPNNDGYLWQIRRGIKYSTLHRDREAYHFRPGQLFEFRCDAEGAPITCRCLGVQRRPLKDIDPVIMAVDGFLSVDDAYARLHVFYHKPPEQPFSRNTMMAAVTFMSEERFSSLDAARRDLLILSEPDAAFRMPEFRDFVFPAIARWISYEGYTAADWIAWIVEHDLVPVECADSVVQHFGGVHELSGLSGRELDRIAADPKHPIHGELILFEAPRSGSGPR